MLVWLACCLYFCLFVGILLSAKYHFLKWCFAFQQKHHIYKHISCFQWCFAFQQNMCVCCTCLLVCWLWWYFAFQQNILSFKTFLLVRLVVCFTLYILACLLLGLWYFAFQPNILSLNGVLLYSQTSYAYFYGVYSLNGVLLYSQTSYAYFYGVLLFSKASLYIFTLSGVLFSAFTLSACYSLLVFTLINHSPGGS